MKEEILKILNSYKSFAEIEYEFGYVDMEDFDQVANEILELLKLQENTK